MKTRAELDALFKRTLEMVNENLNRSYALKEAIAKGDMNTVNRLRVEMEKILEERGIKIKM